MVLVAYGAPVPDPTRTCHHDASTSQTSISGALTAACRRVLALPLVCAGAHWWGGTPTALP